MYFWSIASFFYDIQKEIENKNEKKNPRERIAYIYNFQR